jgi:hypothetical protein
LCAAGALLYRRGWREQDSKDTLALTTESEAREHHAATRPRRSISPLLASADSSDDADA